MPTGSLTRLRKPFPALEPHAEQPAPPARWRPRDRRRGAGRATGPARPPDDQARAGAERRHHDRAFRAVFAEQQAGGVPLTEAEQRRTFARMLLAALPPLVDRIRTLSLQAPGRDPDGSRNRCVNHGQAQPGPTPPRPVQGAADAPDAVGRDIYPGGPQLLTRWRPAGRRALVRAPHGPRGQWPPDPHVARRGSVRERARTTGAVPRASQNRGRTVRSHDLSDGRLWRCLEHLTPRRCR